MSGKAGVTFHHPVAFWAGTISLSTGVLLHLPDYFAAAPMGYRMAAMPMSVPMLAGMALIVAGLLLASYGLFPRRCAAVGAAGGAAAAHEFNVRAMDDAKMTPRHWRLMVVLGAGLVVDTMKPSTLGFVIPGSMEEYGLTAFQVSLYPMTALIGTTVGSVVWGILADRLGRRATMLLSALMFIGTAICGAMPSFALNLVMCFLMGVSAGGMLPIVFAMLAEVVPARERGWVTVLVGGLGTVGGYLVASWAATLIEPLFSWRALWFLGLPTGALVIVLSRYLPESPRFLALQGRHDEAREVARSFGVIIEEKAAAPISATRRDTWGAHNLRQLFGPRYRSQSFVLGMTGLAWGLVNWGFLTWLPKILRELDLNAQAANSILATSALIAVPGTLVVAWLYGRWSSKKTIALFSAMTGVALLTFAALDAGTARSGPVLTVLVVALLVSSTGVVTTLAPYSAEIYPTHFRGLGSGFTAAATKFGGICGPMLIAGTVAVWPGLAAAALVAAVPITASALMIGLKGIETMGRRLEDISGSRPREAEPSLTAER